MEGPSPLPKQARYQKVPDGTLEDDSHPKKKKLPLYVVTNSKSYNTDDGDNNDDDDDDDNDSSVSSRDRNDDDNEQKEINSLVSPGKLSHNHNESSIFRSVTEDTVISRKRSGDQSLTGSHHHLMPTSRNNSSLLDDDELGDFASDWDDDEINLSRYNNAIYYSNNGNNNNTTMHSNNSSHNNSNNPFQVVRDVPLPAEFDDSSIPQRCRRWWYLAQTHWNGMRYSARQRRAARLLSLPSETHRVYVCILTVCCDATDIGIAVAAVSVILWIVLGGIARMGPTYWWLGLTLFMLRVSARRCYNLASTWCLSTAAVRRVRRLRTNSDLHHHHHHHHPQLPHRHHPVANTDDMDISPPPAWTMMAPISEQNTSTTTTTTTNNSSRRGRPHGDVGISLKRVDSPKATSPNPPTPTSV